jgi:hypothetical protein
MPIINCYSFFDLPYKNFDADRMTTMIVNPEGIKGSTDGIYAVPIDDLDIDAIIYTRIGCAVPAMQRHAFADYARECWDVIGGDQVVFADWKKFITR